MTEHKAPPTYKLIPSWAYLLLGVGALTLTVLAGVWLWEQAQLPPMPRNRFLTPAEQASLNVNRAQLRAAAIRNILGVAAGVGALVALILALRKQYSSEHDNRVDQGHKDRTAAASEHDAAERRITELYVKAADQLGSESAPVRLAGLYALERLAQDNPLHQQTIVNLICAYLRMPFVSMEDMLKIVQVGKDPAAVLKAMIGHRNEQEVRVSAQQILAKHLNVDEASPDGGQFWPDIDLNLQNAALFDFKLSDCKLRNLALRGAMFNGSAADFRRTHVTGNLSLYKSTFESIARFQEFSVDQRAHFGGATFKRGAFFRSAEFKRFVTFADSRFNGGANFSRVEFGDSTMLENAFLNVRAANDGKKYTFPSPWRIDANDLVDDLALVVHGSTSEN
ncbi:pentapeptide repeat-containing protein [Micromonospora aurantiaca (nom. illeg.)]|uniref:pentapeptide repeat-containing protein n=1 Tax=Micromonospora aurantiaca (nom. illeg.) TaxID=47850 RepID=UPI003EBFB997